MTIQQSMMTIQQSMMIAMSHDHSVDDDRMVMTIHDHSATIQQSMMIALGWHLWNLCVHLSSQIVGNALGVELTNATLRPTDTNYGVLSLAAIMGDGVTVQTILQETT
eukprot:gene10439-3207_t